LSVAAGKPRNLGCSHDVASMTASMLISIFADVAPRTEYLRRIVQVDRPEASMSIAPDNHLFVLSSYQE
jgi:hypothetical protein